MSEPRGVVVVQIPLESETVANAVHQALGVEADGAPPRTRCTVERKGLEVILRIEAEDVGGLRAGVNSYLRWANTAVEVARVVGPSQH